MIVHNMSLEEPKPSCGTEWQRGHRWVPTNSRSMALSKRLIIARFRIGQDQPEDRLLIRNARQNETADRLIVSAGKNAATSPEQTAT